MSGSFKCAHNVAALCAADALGIRILSFTNISDPNDLDPIKETVYFLNLKMKEAEQHDISKYYDLIERCNKTSKHGLVTCLIPCSFVVLPGLCHCPSNAESFHQFFFHCRAFSGSPRFLFASWFPLKEIVFSKWSYNPDTLGLRFSISPNIWHTLKEAGDQDILCSTTTRCV